MPSSSISKPIGVKPLGVGVLHELYFFQKVYRDMETTGYAFEILKEAGVFWKTPEEK